MNPSTLRSASILSNAHNNLISNNVFTINNANTYNVSSTASSLDLLHKSVAPNAILNSGGRADEVRCYPGTREEVIGLVEKSIAREYNGPRMLWLSGPAGAGKSAIMQTVAERYEEQGEPQANFFFFRADRSRSDASPFAATIMQQIIELYPSLEPAIVAILISNPLLFQMGLQKQIDTLVNQLFPTIRHTLSSCKPLALLIDGLDECDSEDKTQQRQLLQALDTLLMQEGLYLRVVVSSRVEPLIWMAFNQLHSRVDSIFLDEQYLPEKDIRLFVTAEFDKIKSSHYLASKLGPEWPSELDIADIVSKSSGQFIYAATVMRFIAYSSASPILSLQKVQGLVPPSKKSPFAQLDAIYAYILEQVDDLAAVKTLLAIKLLDPLFSTGMISYLMLAYQPRFSTVVFDSCLSELAPLISIQGDRLELFHASFPDFLHDQTRSSVYHIDLERFCAEAIPIWWQKQSTQLLSTILLAVQKLQQPTSKITTALIEFNQGLKDTIDICTVREIVHALHRIYAPHDLQALIKITKTWTTINPKLATFFPQDLFQSATP